MHGMLSIIKPHCLAGKVFVRRAAKQPLIPFIPGSAALKRSRSWYPGWCSSSSAEWGSTPDAGRQTLLFSSACATAGT